MLLSDQDAMRPFLSIGRNRGRCHYSTILYGNIGVAGTFVTLLKRIFTTESTEDTEIVIEPQDARFTPPCAGQACERNITSINK